LFLTATQYLTAAADGNASADCGRRGVAKVEDLDPTSSRAVAEYLSVLDHAAFGGATSLFSLRRYHFMPHDPTPLCRAAAEVVADELAFALRFHGRKRVHNADELMSAIVAKRLVEHLERSGFVIVKRVPISGAAPRARGFERYRPAAGRRNNPAPTQLACLTRLNFVPPSRSAPICPASSSPRLRGAFLSERRPPFRWEQKRRCGI
jgi:hypothetical protein